ncbi:hypothetical protein EMPS_10914 [Entomortierella parvispora]|uniref:Crinkler effector protein N-terminal domain-containing protein n=1 Tax=Entomortierella parvispora TaxID=205924 RepID=A0A9P3HKR7_9FUNG|nr:hypothetical protein EMPS_10914 [Entomortierella parvispora]
MSMAADMLTLHCLISGEPASSAFKIRIVNTDADVDDLKDSIVLKAPRALDRIDANKLILWRATIPADETADKKRKITIDALENKTQLDNPRTRLSKIFPENPDESTYIVVERPKVAFPHAPTIQIPRRPDGPLDILQIIKAVLPFFDRSFMTNVSRWSYKEARHVVVQGSLETLVPRESVYEGELLRILANWLSAEMQVTNQYHITGTGQSHYFCDVVVDPENNPIPVELMATGTTTDFEAHVVKTIMYKRLLGATEAWLINFTMEDKYSQHAKWPTDEELKGGLSVIHVCHNQDFSNVQLLAKFSNSSDETIEVQAEMLNGVWN